MPGLADLVALAKQFGIFEFYLPFLILFSLFYGLLNKIQIFGNPFDTTKKGEGRMARSINLIFSLAAAFFLMAYTPAGVTLTQFFATMFTQTTIVVTTLISGVIIIYLLAKMAGVDIFFAKKGEAPGYQKAAKYLAILGGLVALGVFISSGGLAIFPGINVSLAGLGISMQDAMILGLIALTALAMWYVVHGEGAPSKKEEEKETP